MASASSNNHQKQHDGSKSIEMEEIIKYMSNLPSYLERGKPIQDKALSFGVLDWGRLEQWQYQHKHSAMSTDNKHSPSGSNSSNKSSLGSHLNIPAEEISTKDTPGNRSSEKKKASSRTRTKSSDDMESFQTASSSSSFSSKAKMRIEDEFVNGTRSFQDSSYGTCDGTSHSDPKSDTPKSLRLRNESVKKAIRSEASSGRKPSITCQIKTPGEKELGISSKNSDFKTGSKSRFSFSTSSSKLAAEDSKIKAKKKIDLGNCKEVRVDSSSLPSSRKQALFQMAVKNGRPLFTFSVDDNNNNILAATVRSLTGKDDKNSWVYTFFTFHEIKKKKSGWLYHSSKDRDKGNGYLPNVTAQMKVSNPSISMREFVLSSVDSGGHQILDGELENDLAAIVVSFLRTEADDEYQECFSTTVILPGGHHSVPRKGEPSPLIERWRSGGRCDCGGWDVGCRLRTLANNKVQSNTRSNPPQSFDLFLQGDVINERPFFSLSPINEGIFSVDYNASLPLLQAFSICISVIECQKSSSHPRELRTYVAKQVDDDVAPVTYASLPPVSPVGRV